jgi:GntR family transcriptional regulator, carbon starvation induced regulator
MHIRTHPYAPIAADPTQSVRTLADRAYAALREDVLAARLAPASRLKLAALQKTYGLGISPLREALMRLAAEGLLRAEGQRGFTVAAVSLEELRDLTATRQHLEIAALREAITRGDEDWEAGVVASFHRLSRTPLPADASEAEAAGLWEQRHRAFHHALVAACGSPWTLRLVGQLVDQTERYRRARLMGARPRAALARDVDAEHRAILEAALARDPDRATRLLAAHLARTADFGASLWSEDATGRKRRAAQRAR